MTWVYRLTKTMLWTVGYYAPDGTWFSESDHKSPVASAMRVHYLNGGDEEKNLTPFAKA